jgi:predicted transposase YdaD
MSAYFRPSLLVIYPSRSLEQLNTYPYRAFVNSDQLHRVYLDELGAIEDLPLGVGLMVLTTVAEENAPGVARSRLERAQAADAPTREIDRIMEMVTTIIVYKFTNLSRQEVDAMLGISLQETRVYQESREEGREAGQRSLVLRLLERKCGTLPSEQVQQVADLSVEAIEALGEALLDFESAADLGAWLDRR